MQWRSQSIIVNDIKSTRNNELKENNNVTNDNKCSGIASIPLGGGGPGFSYGRVMEKYIEREGEKKEMKQCHKITLNFLNY